MKNLYILITIIFTSLSCKAQSPIIDIEERPTFWDTPITNAYYKDINNFYNSFEGTWIATKGNKTLKIVLKKIEKTKNDIPYYYDEMHGEYQYSEDGIDKINTLSNTDYFNTSIKSPHLLKSNHKPPCNTCDPNKRRLQIGFYDNIRNRSGNLYLQHTTVNGKPALKGLLYGNGQSYHINNPPQYFEMIVPTGWWTFIKQ